MRVHVFLGLLGFLVASTALAASGGRLEPRDTKQIAPVKARYYKPVAFKMQVADNLGRTPGLADVTVHQGLDGRTPEQALAMVRAKLGTALHPSNTAFVDRTILDTHKAFTVAVNNVFLAGTPSNKLITSDYAGAQVSILGVMSAVHPTVLRVKRPGDATARYLVPEAGGTFRPLEKLPYAVIMKARLEKGAEGGVRVSYHSWNHRLLSDKISTVTEVGSRGTN